MGGWGDSFPLNCKEAKKCDEETEDHLELLWARHWPSGKQLAQLSLRVLGYFVS